MKTRRKHLIRASRAVYFVRNVMSDKTVSVTCDVSYQALLDDVICVVKRLRGVADVTTQQAKVALQELLAAGLSWWVNHSGAPTVSAACPDGKDREAVAAFLESHCPDLKKVSSGQVLVGDVKSIPWATLLPVLLDLARQLLQGLLS